MPSGRPARAAAVPAIPAAIRSEPHPTSRVTRPADMTRDCHQLPADQPSVTEHEPGSGGRFDDGLHSARIIPADAPSPSLRCAGPLSAWRPGAAPTVHHVADDT